MNLWRLKPPIGTQGWTYHETSINEEWYQDYVSGVEKQATGYKTPMKEREESLNKHDGALDEVTRQPTEPRTRDRIPKSRPSIWSKRQTSNRWETTTVPSNKWSEGQTRTKTHYHQKLIRDT